MNARTAVLGLFLMWSCTAGAQAADLDQMNGLQLYNKECSVCHGNMAQKTGAAEPRRTVQIAMAGSGELIAVVPIYGPPLAGIVGKTAGTFSGYSYSEAFLKKMNGVTWDEAKLDAWIKSSQTVVPGSFMFYSQKKADARGRIIEYLKNQ